MMHLRCINKWIKNLNINEKQKEPRRKHDDYVWSCPTCQYVYSENMPDYKCFCQGQREPEPEIGVLPHSCGQKEHYRYINDTKACQHKCTLQCHPGQCPPCNAALKYQFCHCGKQQQQVECGTKGDEYSCESTCDNLLSC